MLDTRIILSGLWVAVMLTYLLGDVLRIFAGDFKTGEIGGMQPTQVVWLGIAVIMLIPKSSQFPPLALQLFCRSPSHLVVAEASCQTNSPATRFSK